MIQIKWLILLYIALQFKSYSQVSENWLARYNGSADFYDIPRSLAVDDSGNSYVTGLSSEETGLPQLAIIKYNPKGEELWKYYYPGFSGFDIQLDSIGSVYATGSSDSGNTTIKISQNGFLQWAKNFSENQSDVGRQLALDRHNNIIVTGYSVLGASYYDFCTMKYDASGNRLWVRYYTGPGHNEDIPNAIAVDDSGNVYVTGYIHITDYYRDVDLVTIKYSPDGDELWIDQYNGTQNHIDEGKKIKINDGYIYVAGIANGTFGGPLPDDGDYITIKYDPSGNRQWLNIYNGTDIGLEEARDLTFDSQNNIYVTGLSYSLNPVNYENGIGDLTTIKYTPSGNELFVNRFNYGAALNDSSENGANAITIDKNDNYYVTGFTGQGYSSWDYITQKYDETGNLLWTSTYNGTNNRTDEAIAIKLDDSDNVYISGSSNSITNNQFGSPDWVTIKYSKTNATQVETTFFEPKHFLLKQNYPNPFNPTTEIQFYLPEKSQVNIEVYDILGRKLRTLFTGLIPPGTYTAQWNGTDNAGLRVSSGIYIYRMVAGNFIESRKMVLIK
jgi:FlgD Ig-like domain/Beta-propeller repeat